MSGSQKKSFASFLRHAPEPAPAAAPPSPVSLRPVATQEPPAPAMPPPPAPLDTDLAEGEGRKPAAAPIAQADAASALAAPPVPLPSESPPGIPASPPERIRQVTSTGRVRTHTANRQLPGVTLRLSEARWERLKMLSLQERRPIQEILGDAMDAYMKVRGLPW